MEQAIYGEVLWAREQEQCCVDSWYPVRAMYLYSDLIAESPSNSLQTLMLGEYTEGALSDE